MGSFEIHGKLPDSSTLPLGTGRKRKPEVSEKVARETLRQPPETPKTLLAGIRQGKKIEPTMLKNTSTQELKEIYETLRAEEKSVEVLSGSASKELLKNIALVQKELVRRGGPKQPPSRGPSFGRLIPPPSPSSRSGSPASSSRSPSLGLEELKRRFELLKERIGDKLELDLDEYSAVMGLVRDAQELAKAPEMEREAKTLLQNLDNLSLKIQSRKRTPIRQIDALARYIRNEGLWEVEGAFRTAGAKTIIDSLYETLKNTPPEKYETALNRFRGKNRNVSEADLLDVLKRLAYDAMKQDPFLSKKEIKQKRDALGEIAPHLGALVELVVGSRTTKLTEDTIDTVFSQDPVARDRELEEQYRIRFGTPPKR